MRNLFKLFTVILLFSCKNIEEEIYVAKPQDAIVSAFFGLDNALPSLILCNQLGSQLDGMQIVSKESFSCFYRSCIVICISNQHHLNIWLD